MSIVTDRADTPSLREATWMALDAYDSRVRIQSPAAPTVADPDPTEEFSGWMRVPTSRASAARNADAAYRSGMEANVYVDAAAGEAVIAFRGTEFSPFIELLDDLDLGTIRDAHLDNDVLTLLGYYQDEGETIAEFTGPGGGLEVYLRETFGASDADAGEIEDVLGVLADLGTDAGVRALARAGEQDLRNQVESALATVLEVAEANPELSITLTGHSLGGALAAALSGALGLPAVLFDPAPYAAQGLLGFARTRAEELVAARELDTGALGLDLDTPPETLLADSTETHRLEGSFVPGLYLTASPLDLPDGASTDRVLDLDAFRADPLSLHGPEVLALALDSAERAGPGRPDLAALSDTLPSLVRRLEQDGLAAPADGSPAAFQRALLVFDPLYRLLAEAVARIDADLARFAPEGSGETRFAALEVALVDIALAGLGDRVADGTADAPGSLAGLFGDPAGGPGEDVLVGAFGTPETLRPGTGADFVATGGGAPDTIAGSPAALDGDTIFDLEAEDRIVFEGVGFAASDTRASRGGRQLGVDTDGDGEADAILSFSRPADTTTLSVTREGPDTVLRLAPLGDGGLPYAEAQTVGLLYEGAFGRIADTAGLNYWIDRREDGLGEIRLSGLFLESREFAERIGEPESFTDAELVTRLFENLLGRGPAEAGLDHWTGRLDDADFGRPQLLLAISKSPENMAAVDEIERLVELEPGIWDFV